jgi:hypothetical protein
MTGTMGQLFAALLFAIAEFQLPTMKENQTADITAHRLYSPCRSRLIGLVSISVAPLQ